MDLKCFKTLYLDPKEIIRNPYQRIVACPYLIKITEVNNADCEKVEVVIARVVPEHVKVLASQVRDHRDDRQRHQQSSKHLGDHRVQLSQVRDRRNDGQ